MVASLGGFMSWIWLNEFIEKHRKLRPTKTCYFCCRDNRAMKYLDVNPWIYAMVCNECAVIQYGKTLVQLNGW